MTVEIAVDNRIRIAVPVDKELLGALKAAFVHDNPQYWKLRGMGYAVGKERREIRTWEEERGEISFPRGGLARVRAALRERGLEWRIIDRREEGAEELDVEYRAPFGGDVAAYQVEAVEAVTRRQNALLRAPTGGRKTSLGMMMIARWRVPTIVLVDDTGLAEQWLERVGLELGVPQAQVGRVWGGKFELRPITVALHASVISKAEDPEKRRRMTRFFGGLIADEVHGVAANRARAAVDLFPAKYRVGISADMKRKDGKECIIHDLFGAIAYEIDREELVRQGVILDVEIRVVETAFEAPWYGGGDGEVDFNRLLDEMQADDARNELAVASIAEEVAAGEQVIALAHRRDHCRLLDSMLTARRIRSGFLIGGDDYAVEYDRTKAALLAREIDVGIGTMKAIGQGIDVPGVGAGLIATPVAANRLRFNQARGRFCRAPKGKTRAVLWYLWDSAIWPSHLKNLVEWNPTVRVRERGEWVDAVGSATWDRVEAGRRRSRNPDVFGGG